MRGLFSMSVLLFFFFKEEGKVKEDIMFVWDVLSCPFGEQNRAASEQWRVSVQVLNTPGDLYHPLPCPFSISWSNVNGFV